MGPVVAGHALEATGQHLLLLADLLEGLGHFLGKSLQLVPDLGQVTLDLIVELLGLVHVTAPLLAVVADLVNLQLVGDHLDLEHPLFTADVALDHLLLQRFFSLVLSSLSAGSSEIDILIDVVGVADLGLRVHISDISSALELVVVEIVVIVGVMASIVANDWFFELEFIFETDVAQGVEHSADSLAVAGLQLVGRHVELDAQFVELEDDALTGGHGVAVLVPSGNLVIVDREQPRDERDEVDELLALVGSLGSKADLTQGLEALLLAEEVLVVEQLQHVENVFHGNYGVSPLEVFGVHIR
mmetsp:Transcript_33235/g.50955  ORF Transcript_33235/g.50955 Transcript_33235/m.50955 type:complete len:301 (+) Transcript_33235:361-1263(+)